MRTSQIVGVVATVAMMVAIGYGIASGGFVAGLRAVLGDPWGRVTMIDLAVGLMIMGAWITLREQSLRRAAPWWIALALTGNLASGVYLIRAAARSADTSEFLLGRLASKT